MDMMHYHSLDSTGIPYGSHSPNVTVMNRGPSAAVMQAAWQQQNQSCRYNPTTGTTDYISPHHPAAAFGATDSAASFYQDSYRHSLISANTGMPGVYYPAPQMLVNRGLPSPPDIAASPLGNLNQQELASPNESQESKGEQTH